MVTVDYFGRFGNNMFQYAFARRISEIYGLKLGTKWTGQLFDAREPEGGRVGSGERFGVYDRNSQDVYMGSCENASSFHLHGYFQNGWYYSRDAVKAYWSLPDIPESEIDEENLVVHLRLTDYFWANNRSVISPLWYIQLIRKEKFKRLFIVVEPHCTNAAYLRHFKMFKPEIVSGTVEQDFNFLRKFKRIVCSNSTLCWWAAFLGVAEKIYLFKPWMNKPLAAGCINMEGATVVDGQFYRDKNLERLDWTDYWKRPDSYFKGKK